MSTDKLHALFFTAQGNGPDAVSLWVHPMREIVDGGEVVAPRTLGLRVGPADDFPLMYSRAGGYQMEEAAVRALRDAFTAWLDAPRDEARAAAEVVRRNDDLMLLKTSLGEWGVASEDDPAAEATWFAGDRAEASARRLFASERGKIACFGCAVEVTGDESEPATEDGDRYCPKCAAEAREEFNATTFAHDDGSPGEDGCEWSGPGSEIVDFDEDALCPKCGAPVTPVVTPSTAKAPSCVLADHSIAHDPSDPTCTCEPEAVP